MHVPFEEQIRGPKPAINHGRGQRNILTTHRRLRESKTYRKGWPWSPADLQSIDSRQQYRARCRQAAKANAHAEYLERRQ